MLPALIAFLTAQVQPLKKITVLLKPKFTLARWFSAIITLLQMQMVTCKTPYTTATLGVMHSSA
jgi:hypothetical protein